MLHVRAGSLSHGVSDAMNSETHLDGRWLISNAARRMACDAGLLAVEEDEAGNVLNIGRITNYPVRHVAGFSNTRWRLPASRLL